MLLIKEPRIEKCYITLAERVGGIDFHAGTLFEQEGYKYNVFREGHEIMMNPEGSYFERGGKALGIVPEGLQGRQNLVDWHDVSDYYGKKDREPLIEAGLKQLYTTDDDKGSFEILRNAFGNKYAIISYFFFLKSKDQYAVMRPANFVKRLPMVGASTKCTEKCTWENYCLFLSILGEVQNYLSSRVDDVGLLEAHSFLWALWQI